ncbi:hypothetical protein [Segetibacter aerophilus]|uniref:Uncharacterized protein n=1 Tax=Segetibacter aerophilus TaxID=670293 RepID=A0A512BC30_9BACT|nr:hypothetical protein [Segetibacter aerophilus]GEO09533.1 hypothetical protein SAE01_20290 [Segetibacter aerophilus]
MKFLIATILTALLSFATALFLPWWIIALVAFIVAAVIPQKPLLAFLSASIAIFLLWGFQSYLIDQQNNHLLAAKVADLLFHKKSYLLIIIVTAIVGAIVSGFAGLTGSLLRAVIVHNGRNKKS